MDSYDMLRKILVTDLKVPADIVHPDATLKDLEFDSIALAELSLVLERNTGTEISDDELKRAVTLAEMAAIVETWIARDRA